MGFLDWFGLNLQRPGFVGPELQLASWETPNQILTPVQIAISDLYAGDIDELPLSRGQAHTVPAVQAGLNLIDASCARLPLQAKSADGTLQASQPSWTTNTGDPNQSAYLRNVRTFEDIFFDGFSLWHVEQRGYDNYPLAMRHVPAFRWEYTNNGTFLIDGKAADSADAIFIESGYPGLLVAGCRTLRVAVDIERALRARAAIPIPPMILQNESNDQLIPEEVQQLVNQYAKARRSLTGAVAYVDQGLKLEILQDDPNNWLMEARAASASDIAKHTGIPAGLLETAALNTSLNYTTELGQIARFQDLNVSLWLDPIEARLSQGDVTPRGTTIAYDRKAFEGQTPAPITDRPAPVAQDPSAAEPAGITLKPTTTTAGGVNAGH